MSINKLNRTWKLPWFAFVKINVGECPAGEAAVEDFSEKVTSDEFFISRMESKPRWQTSFSVIKMVCEKLHSSILK